MPVQDVSNIYQVGDQQEGLYNNILIHKRKWQTEEVQGLSRNTQQ